MSSDRPVGMVLCGGKSTRMGVDKVWLPWRGRPLLQHIVSQLEGFCEPVVVVHAAGQLLPSLPSNVKCLVDVQPGLGPMGGLYTGLKALCNRQDAVLVCACDHPDVNSTLAGELLAALTDYDAIVLKDANGVQPLPGLYRNRIVRVVADKIRTEELSLHGLLRSINTLILGEASQGDETGRPTRVRPMNTFEEYVENLGMHVE